MKKILSLVLCLLMATLCFGGAMAETDYTVIPEDFLVGFINYSDTLTAGVLVHEGMTRWCNDNNVEMIVLDAKGQADAQAQACDTLIQQGVDVIVDFNFNTAGGTYLIEKTVEAGIPLISVDYPYESEAGFSYYCGVSNPEAGEIAGKAAADMAKVKFGDDPKAVDYVVTTKSVSLEKANDRTGKAYDGMLAGGYDIPPENFVRLEVGTGNATDMALQQATDFLTAHPGATCVFVCGNDDTANGFLSAVESQGRSDDCIIVTCGCELPSQTWLKADHPVVKASVDFGFKTYADTIMPLAVRLVNGDPSCERLNYVKLGYLDASNVRDVYPD